MTPFQHLVRLFEDRFFENDTVSPDGGFETNLWQILGFLATPGLFMGLFSAPTFMDLSLRKPGLAVDWALRISRLFFPAYAFAVTGFATVFEWDTLFPDRRDFLVLATFPIKLRDILAAKFTALGRFLLILIAATALIPSVTIPVFSYVVPQVHASGFMRVVAAQFVSTAGASAFAFFAVAAFQGVLINVTSPRIFRRASPWIQAGGLSLMVTAFLSYPIYSSMLIRISWIHPNWLWYFPPFWFTGLYDFMLRSQNRLFASLGIFALEALGIAIAAFCITWAAGFRRHYRRTLEAEDTSTQRPGRSLFDRFTHTPEERAIFQFSGRTLARSVKHRLFLATYWSVGISFGLLTTISVQDGHAAVSTEGLRALPLLIAFFVVSGFRATFQFPAELGANWVFRITEFYWAETARRAARKRVLTSGLLPVVLLFLPLEITQWGWLTGSFHAMFQLAAGALLIEVLFWNFEKVPFTCSYFQGRVNLALLAGAYLYGFTSYSFRMADLEKALDSHPRYALLFFSAAAIVLVLSWRRKPAASPVSFDASVPQIQTLDLT